MKLIARVLLLVLLACVLAVVLYSVSHAQTVCPNTPACNPTNEPDRTKCGPWLKGTVQLPSGATGQWQGFWWVSEVTPTQTNWCAFKWAALDKFVPTNPRQLYDIANAVQADPANLTVGIMDALSRFSVRPPAGSPDEFDYLSLHYEACKAMAAQPPGGTWITAPTCLAPTPPPPAGWKALGGTIFTYANGKLTGITSRKATPGAPTGMPKATVGPTNYCSVTGGPETEVTACAKP